MKTIDRIILRNFKRFTTFECNFNSQLNILIGDNESGKSSILQAIDIVLSGSRNKVENFGLESLFNVQVINDFMQSDRKIEKLPELTIELYFNEQDKEELNGKNNIKEELCDGLKLECKPNHDEYSNEICTILKQTDANFPFEFYTISFSTFADQPHHSYKKYLKHIVLDHSQMSSEYAIKEYVQDIYNTTAQHVERLSNQHKYREHKETFKNSVLSGTNSKLTDNYSFAIKHTSKSNLETDLAIFEDGINIENKGKGKQCFIKTDLALLRSPDNLDIILLEEPENHLSHINMQKLIQKISQANDKQIFITTHSDLISARLDLRKTILLNSNDIKPVSLNTIPTKTAEFFMKAPDNNILQYVLSKKVILVEGDAEYILMETMYRKVANEELSQSDVHIISVGGTSFKRYLDLAKVLSIKTAVITDNDGDINKNITQKYTHYTTLAIPCIKIFHDSDTTRSTFELCLYNDNKATCDSLFSSTRRTLSVLDFMLDNKAECAFTLLDDGADINVPQYIKDAIEWIRK